jgi:hypothetical protein
VININDYISDEALEKMGSDKRKRQKVLFEIINTEKSYALPSSPPPTPSCWLVGVALTCGW